MSEEQERSAGDEQDVEAHRQPPQDADEQAAAPAEDDDDDVQAHLKMP